MVNLSVTSSRNALVKTLPQTTIPWKRIVEEMSSHIIDELCVGDPLETVRTSNAITPIQYLVKPLLPLNQPTIIFGKGGCCKSKLATLLSVVVQLPWEDNPFGWGVGSHSANTLYLDWETDKDTFQYNITCIVRGMELPHIDIQYRRCTHKLVDDLEAVQEHIMSMKSRFVVIDSAGKACGGDLKDAAVVNDFFWAIREMATTVLIIHIAV